MTIVPYSPPTDAPSGVHQVVAYTRLGRELYPSFAPVVADIRNWWNTPYPSASRRTRTNYSPTYLPARSQKRLQKMRFPRKRSYQRSTKAFRGKTPRTTITIPNRRIEVKQRQSGLSTVPFSNISQIVRLGGVPQGTTNTDREGNIIKRVSQELRMSFNTVSGLPGMTARMIIFTYRANQEGAPSYLDVLQTDNHLSAYNIRVMKNITIMKDVLIPLIAQAGVVGAFQTRNLIKVFKFNERSSVEYDGSTGSDEGDKEIYMLLITNAIFGQADYIFTERFVDA